MFEGDPDESFIRDLFELRGVIEPAACSFAALRRTDGQLAEMARALSGMRRHGLATLEGQTADQQFHKSILAATHNEALVALASSIGAAVSWTTKFKQRNRALPRDPVPDHAAVFEAIAAQDPTAAHDAMATLLRLAMDDIIQSDPTQPAAARA
jgi:DNA-binding FadR family transcriptional regulator